MANTIPLSVPDDLLDEVRETAKQTNLSIQDVLRQSTKLGLPALKILRASFRTSVKLPQRLSVWDALASGSGLNLDLNPMRKEKVREIKL